MTELKGVRMKISEDDVGVARRRVYIRESKYDDLKQLESAIRAAYVAKELRAQVVEAEAKRVAAQARERLRDEVLKRAGEEAARSVEEESRLKKSAGTRYGVELQAAIKSREKERASVAEIERREREILEEVSRVMEETEETRKMSEKLESAARISREYRIFEEVKEIRLEKEAELSEAERRRDLNYSKEIEERILALEKARMKQKLAREAAVDTVSKIILESRDKRAEIEALIAELIAEEKLFEDEVRLGEEKRRRKSAREEAAAEVERHRVIVEERRLRHRIEEEEFAAAVMRRVLEDRRIEILTVEARRRKQIQYRDTLEEIIAERRARRAEEVAKLEESLGRDRARGEALRKRVKEMRERLIIKHAGNVAEFIAKEALSTEERIVLARLSDDSEERELK